MVAAPPQILLHIIDRHDDNFKCSSNNVFFLLFFGYNFSNVYLKGFYRSYYSLQEFDHLTRWTSLHLDKQMEPKLTLQLHLDKYSEVAVAVQGRGR